MLFLLPRSPSLSPILLHAFRPPVSGFSRQWPALAFFPLCSLGGSFFIGASGRTSTTGFRTLKNRNRPVNPVTFSNEHSNNISHSPQKLSRLHHRQQPASNRAHHPRHQATSTNQSQRLLQRLSRLGLSANSGYPTDEDTVSSILDIDLDYFRFFDDPVGELDRLLTWADRPIDIVVEHHDEAFERWVSAVKRRAIRTPGFILHADEHHDMLSDRRPIGFGNFLYFAMRRWPKCRVHWLVNGRIDHPDMWLSERAWKSVGDRFTLGSSRPPRAWLKPDFVSVCTSPGFIHKTLRRKLLRRLHANTATQTPGSGCSTMGSHKGGPYG